MCRVLLSMGLAGMSACGIDSAFGAIDASVASDSSAVSDAGLFASEEMSATDTRDAADAVFEAHEASTCASASDCFGPALADGVSCCIDGTCIAGEAAVHAFSCNDADVQLIDASNYDQSCQTDSDCLAVAQGNFCLVGAANCTSAAINRNAYSQYQLDVARTNAGMCVVISSCPVEGVPCCDRGSCRMGMACP